MKKKVKKQEGKMDISKGYYDGSPIIPEDIKRMSIEELDREWEKIAKKHKKEN